MKLSRRTLLKYLGVAALAPGTQARGEAAAAGKASASPVRPREEPTFRAAASKVEITPPAGVRMAPFSDDTVSLAAHDPLWARCLVLEDGRRRVALVSMDLLLVWADIVKSVRAQASASTGISPEAILVAATHTHSGPGPLRAERTAAEKAYWEGLPARIAGVIAEAASRLAPARVSAASGWAAIGINRREKTPCGQVILGRNELGVFDPELGVVRLDRADGRPLAALLNFACHGVCLREDNRLLSADYPGYAVRVLEERLGGGATGLFFNGAGGNIDPREVMTVGGERAAVGSFLIAERAGEVLATEACRVWEEAVALESPSLSHVIRVIGLPGNPKRALRGAEESGNILQAEVQALTVGPLAFVGWPGEAFCELGMALKRRSSFLPTYVIGYANDYIGYIPTRAAYAEGGYEPDSARGLADNAGEVLVEQSALLLKSLHGGVAASRG